MHHQSEPHDTEAPDLPDPTRHGITLLSRIYLEAGLPLDLAVRSAAADCALFDEELLCA
jgi:hypothetical protein